jgi:SAM-dependent methyltransferase
MARGEGGASKAGALYQNPLHFDLADIPFEHGCEDRWSAIRHAVNSQPRSVLDIGSNLGYFCNRFAEIGCDCIGVEYLPEIASAARTIANAEEQSITILTGNVLDEELLQSFSDWNFDIVLALNIFHHFVKTKEGAGRVKVLMSRLKARQMFFEPHLQKECQMKGAYLNPAPAEFAELVKEWGGFRSVAPIYTAEDGRTVFLLQG